MTEKNNKNILYCSFCGKSQHEVRKLIAGPTVFICDECVELFMDIIKEENKDVFIKVRSTGRLIKAKVLLNSSGAEVILQENEKGISSGQACVFYYKNTYGDKVLGGGWIVRTVNKYLST